MKQTPPPITLRSRFLGPRRLLSILVSVLLPALITSTSVVAASDSAQAAISETDVEELSLRLSQLAVTQMPNTGSVANVDADGDSHPR